MANANPRAMMHAKTMSRDDYMNARWVSEPLCLFDNCLESDGALAVVIASAEPTLADWLRVGAQLLRRELAAGPADFETVERRSRVERHRITKYLATLRDLGLVTSRVPVTESGLRTRSRSYMLADGFLRLLAVPGSRFGARGLLVNREREPFSSRAWGEDFPDHFELVAESERAVLYWRKFP